LAEFTDNRVHAVLYFINPTGHSLREIDIEFMRRLGPRANVIPVIAKADSMIPSELAAFKQRVMEDIEYYKIPIYNFPYDDEEDDEETIEENNELRVRAAVVMLPINSFANLLIVINGYYSSRCYRSPLLEVKTKSSSTAVMSDAASTHGVLLKSITQSIATLPS
jgi:hypothetical protein